MKVILTSIAAALGLGPRSAEMLVCEGVLRLTPQHSLHVVRLGGRRWVIACHPAGAAVVAEQSTSSGEIDARAARAGAC